MSAWKEGTESMLTLTLGERKYSADLSVDTLETGNLVVLIRELDIIEWGGVCRLYSPSVQTLGVNDIPL